MRNSSVVGLFVIVLSVVSLPEPALGREIASVRELLGAAPKTAETVTVAGYYPASHVGGGKFTWDSSCDRSRHNGGTIISPTVGWDGAAGQTQLDFLDGRGETSVKTPGCWRRPQSNQKKFTEWGGRGDWNGTQGTDNQPIWQHMRSAGFGPGPGQAILDPGYSNDYWFGNTVVLGTDNLELIIPTGVTARSTRPSSQGGLFLVGRLWFKKAKQPPAVQSSGISGGGTIITTSPGDNENAVSFSAVHGGWLRGMKLPDSNRKAVTMQYDYEDIVIENNEIGRTGHDAITVQGLFDAKAGNPESPHRRVRILNNVIHDAGRHGFLAQRNAAAAMTDIELTGNVIEKAAERGITFNGVDRITLSNNVVRAANVGAWFSQCSAIKGDVDVRNIATFGLYLSRVRDYDFGRVFIARAMKDAIRDDRPQGSAHIGKLEITDSPGQLFYKALSPAPTATALVVDQLVTQQKGDPSKEFQVLGRHLKPRIMQRSVAR
jgi:hypothetical protein